MTTVRRAVPEDVERFCEQEGLQPYLALAYDLIEKYFPGAQEVEAEYADDPDSDDEWINLLVAVDAPMSDIIACDEQLTDAWLAAVPWPEADRIRILADPA